MNMMKIEKAREDLRRLDGEITVTARFMGYREVNCAPVFFVPIQAIKPLNPYPCSVPAYSRIGSDFEVGVWYDVVIRKSDPGPATTWDVVRLADY